MCPVDRLEEIQKQMKAPSEIYVVEEGDHSLQVTQKHLKRESISQEDVDNQIQQKIQEFLAKNLAADSGSAEPRRKKSRKR